VWKALTGWWVLWLVVLAGGGLYYLVQDSLPRTVGNGIDSFGVRADLRLPFPSGGLIRLHGAMVMLLCSALGVFILHRRTAVPVAAVEVPALPVAELLSSTVVSSAGTLIPPPAKVVLAVEEQVHARYQPHVTVAATRQPETSAPAARSYVQRPADTAILTPEAPPTCRLTTPPPIAVVMPRRTPGIGKTHPCYVVGGLKPSGK
jgi:hypothetical protein